MDRLFKRVFFVLLAIVALLAVLGLLVSWQVNRKFTPQTFVDTLERNLNCRAEAEVCQASLWSFPAKLRIEGFAMGFRDENAEQAIPLDERGPRMGATQRVLAVDSLELGINLTDLLKGQLDFRDLVVSNLDAHIITRRDGTNTFKQIFSKPATVAGVPQSPAKDRTRFLVQAATGEADAPAAEVRGFGVYAADLKLPTTLDRLEIINGHLRIDKLAKNRITRFRNLNLVLSNVRVDAERLDEAEWNHCFLDVDTRFMLEDLATGKTHLDFNVRSASQGEAVPFDHVDGQLNPHIVLEVEIAKGSTVDGHPMLRGLGHALEAAKDLGLDFANDWDSSVEISKTTSGRLRYQNEIVQFESDILIPLGVYGMGVKQKSWIDPETDSHFLDGYLSLSPEATVETFGKLEAMLSDKLPPSAYASGLATAKAKLLDNQQRFRLGFTSESKYDNPQVSVDNPVTDLLEDLLSNPDAIEGLLRGLLDR